MENLTDYFLSILLGYLIGSISLGYFFGRVLKKIDIRQYGSHNTGATNTFQIVGKVPGVITCLFDFSKGIIVIWIIQSIFNFPPIVAYLSGLLAILGHIFPFYLGFRGGIGRATSYGLLFFFIFEIFKNHLVSPLVILVPLACGFLFFFVTKNRATRRSTIPNIIAFSSLLAFIYLTVPSNVTTLFLGIVLAFLFLQSIFDLKRDKKFLEIIEKGRKIRDLRSWRTYLRPLAILLPIIYYFYGKKPILIFAGVLALSFIFVDLFRFGFKKFNIFLLKNLFIKEKEVRVFSSMSFFLLACFIAFLVFSKPVAILAITFLTFGDLFAKFCHPLYGQRGFFQKTLEGMLAYFVGCLIFGFIFIQFLDFPFLILFIGALVASITESLPIGIDDNFTVALVSGAVMQLMTIY